MLDRCDIRVPAFATVDLTGERVDEVISRGKHLLTRVGDLTIHTHLKMEGSWQIYRPGARWRRPGTGRRASSWQRRRWQAVGFQLGIVEVLPRHAEDTVVGHLGPDLLGPDWDADEAVLERLAAAPDAPMGVALLDQGDGRHGQRLPQRTVLPARGAADPAGRPGPPRRAARRPRPPADQRQQEPHRTHHHGQPPRRHRLGLRARADNPACAAAPPSCTAASASRPGTPTGARTASSNRRSLES